MRTAVNINFLFLSVLNSNYTRGAVHILILANSESVTNTVITIKLSKAVFLKHQTITCIKSSKHASCLFLQFFSQAIQTTMQ